MNEDVEYLQDVQGNIAMKSEISSPKECLYIENLRKAFRVQASFSVNKAVLKIQEGLAKGLVGFLGSFLELMGDLK